VLTSKPDTTETDRANWNAGNKDHRAPASPVETTLASDLREGRTTTSAGKWGQGAELTFSSQGRQSAASSAAQKSTASALSHTSQIVRIPTPRRSRRQCHRSAAIRATKPRVPRLAPALPCDPFPALRCRRTTAAAAERDVDQEAAAEQRPHDERCGSD